MQNNGEKNATDNIHNSNNNVDTNSIPVVNNKHYRLRVTGEQPMLCSPMLMFMFTYHLRVKLTITVRLSALFPHRSP